MTTPSLSDARRSEPVRLPTERRCPFDPPSELGELRDTQPLSRLRFPDGHVGWLVTNHELARAVLGDPRISNFFGGSPSNHPERQAARLFAAIQHDDSFPAAVRALVERYWRDDRLLDAFQDPEVVRTLHEHSLSKISFAFKHPPEHTRVRRILAPYFTVRRTSEHRAHIEHIVSDRLDAMERVGPPVDLVETFALAIPSLLTCALYGVPESERGTFERLSVVKHNPNATVEDILEADKEFRAFACELIQRKRAQPGDDLLSALVHSGQMTENELVANTLVLVNASHTTTTLTIAFCVLALLQDRDRWDILRTESAPIGQIVEELLRYTTADQAPEVRIALEDVEIGGTVIKAFERVVVWLPGANRDPKVFAEPDRFDPTRQAAKQLAFGYGIHQCLGQHLVRLELQTALKGLAHRFPTLDLAVPLADIPWHNGDRQLYGPIKVPVTW